jgi:hypothetical protein
VVSPNITIDLEVPDRLRLRQCLSEVGRDPALGPEEPIDRQQDDGRPLTAISDWDVPIDTETLNRSDRSMVFGKEFRIS